MKMIKGLITALMLVATPAFAGVSTTGTISIPIKEYETLKAVEKIDGELQYWNMSFERILKKENNNYTAAWVKHRFWNLREISLNGPVAAGNVHTLINQMKVLNEIDNINPITIVINSPGGSIFAGFNLLNAMNSSTAPVNTRCDGWAMSMAAVILANGTHREVNKGCIFMIHEAANGGKGGQTTEHIKGAERLVNVENVLAEILSENSGLSVKDVRKAWEYETFYNARETVMLGFADEVTAGSKRSKVPGSRIIPDYLLPLNKMRSTMYERLTK